jgi:putative PIN family toxin of toxin-antitoxin system
MIDTNVFISALLRQGSVPDIVLNNVCQNHELVLCSQIISEIREVANRRFPKKAEVIDDLFAQLRYELVPEPKTAEIEIGDAKDQPILNAAITSKVDILITGDKHFLQLGLEILQIFTLSEYKDRYIKSL